ncbi:MAG TPA: UDP-N-acetylmuramate--L-alanine ligase [Chloroflexota bacterium]|nr:UDP-N-acetylmuramate--L-alanine ligase [Chloroflexota bacterium]
MTDPAEAQMPLRALRPGAHIHLVGVAGAGMNALAPMLQARGYRLSGSDMQRSAQVERLLAAGMMFTQGHDAANVCAADLVIISAAVRETNVEVAAARAAGIPVVKRAAALGWLLEGLRTIAVAGTHGKTTTTAMLAVILRQAGFDPTFMVGGEVLELEASGYWGAGAWAVVEADEYDRSFLQFRPEIAVITNVEPDHLDYYGSVAAMHEAYARFMARIRPGGTLVLNVEDPYLRTVAPPLDVAVVTCGLRPDPTSWGQRPDWRADRIAATETGVSFELDGYRGQEATRIDLLLAGRHNVCNAVQACAAASTAGVPLATCQAALGTFRGTGRRFQVVGEAADVLVIDDYAHHPTEVRVNLAAARARFPGRRLVVVFQPHTYSRTKHLFEDFARAFNEADLLILTDIYAARETDTLGMDVAQLHAAIAAQGHVQSVVSIRDLAAIPAALAPRLRAGDVVLTLGAGSITTVGPALLAALQQDGRP